MEMTYNFLPEAAAAVFGLILSLSLRFKYTDATEANQYYRHLAYAVTAAAGADVAASVFHTFFRRVPPVVFLINTTVFYLTTVISGYCLLRYILMRAGRLDSRFSRIQQYLLYADCILLVFNLFTRTFFDYAPGGVVSYGTLHLPVCYGVAFWFILVSCVVQGTESEKNPLIQRVVLRLCGISILVAFIIQFFFLRHILFSFAVAVLSVYLVFFAVEMPVYIRLEEATASLVKKQAEAEEAARKALRASRAKSNFLANTSHEIRTPMNAILGMNDMIENGTEDARIRQASAEIRTAGENLLQIINDVLDYSRIESGRAEVNRTNFSLGALMADLDAGWRRVVEEKALRFTIGIEDGLTDCISGDRTKIKQILDNLVSNACKYTENGEIRIAVKYGAAGGETHLIASVADTGIGIRASELKAVFSLFTRAAIEENRDKQGAGLGLKIADELARLMGGSIRAESEYGKGSVFTLRLPVVVREETEEEDGENEPREKTAKDVYEEVRRKQQEESRAVMFRADGARVLVVDDTVVNLTIVKNMIEQTGATAHTVMSGAECLKVLQEEKRFDLVFLDYMMPEMDGIRTLEMIRMIPGCESGSLTVIALTASIDDNTAYYFLKAGFDDYLPKPVKTKSIQSILKKHLSKMADEGGAV